MEGSILHIRTSTNNKVINQQLYHYINYIQYIAIGTSLGKVGIYTVEHIVTDGIICPITVYTAHYPHNGVQDKRFGQLNKQ